MIPTSDLHGTRQEKNASIAPPLSSQAESARAEMAAYRSKLDAEKAALDTRTALLAPHFRALEEGRSLLESSRRQG